MTRIKISGITTEEQAIATAKVGADFIGLVFAPSPRQVTAETTARIIAALKNTTAKTEAVGVFVNADADTVNKTAEYCRLDRVQLSGDETWEYCRQIGRPIIKAMRVSVGNQGQVLKEIEDGMKILDGRKITVLLDTKSTEKYGGTGEVFDWEAARPVARQYPVIIAGGLKPDNVARAIKTTAPWGVDVATGVETRGAKDMDKIRRFIKAVRQADVDA